MKWLAAFLGFGIPSWLVYVLAIGAIAGVIYGKGRLDQKHSEEIATIRSELAQVKADLASNEAIRRQAEADAARSEADEQKLKELLDALQKTPPSCALTREHVDGVRRIDQSP